MVQVYATGKKNVLLGTTNIMGWVINGMVYGAVIGAVYFIACWDTFKAVYPVYGMGTLIFTGVCLAMQLKVAFMHHSWNWIEVAAMTISVLGMFVYFIILSASPFASEYDMYWVSMWLYAQGFYWFFGVFTISVVCILIDVLLYYGLQFFMPTQEMMYQECSRNVCKSHI